MDAKEQLLKRRQEEEELNSAYRQVFGKDESTRIPPQKRVIKDFYDILYSNVFTPDKDGHYHRDTAALNDGARKQVKDFLKRINSTPDKMDAEDAKTKPKTIK